MLTPWLDADTVAGGGRWCLRLFKVGNVTVEPILIIGDADPEVEDEVSTLLEYSSGVDDCPRVLLGIVDDKPYLAPAVGILSSSPPKNTSKMVDFRWGAPRSRTRRCNKI